MTLTVVVMVITSLLFFRGKDAVGLSKDKLDTSGRARRAMEGLTQVVSGGVKIGGFAALEVSDGTPAVNTDDCHLDITTREDFLASDYSESAVFNPLDSYYRYRVAFESATGELKLYKLRAAPVEIDTSVPPRLLGRGLMGCSFEKLTVASISVGLTARAENDDPRRPGGVSTSTLRGVLTAPGS